MGLPLALSFAENGVKVEGLDVDRKKHEMIRNGLSYIKHIPGERINACVSEGFLQASDNFNLIKNCSAVVVCVPTPLNRNREPDLTYLLKTAETIAPCLKAGCLVVLESTTYPGTTEGEFRHILESGSGLQAGADFHLAYSPEREDPGNPQSDVSRVPKIVGGFTPSCREKALQLYGKINKNIKPVSSCRVAEAAKLTENIFRSVNIALVNELKLIYATMKIDVWEVIEAAKTKPFGYMPFYPGPGLGGHCIPIDPFYLTWKAREFGHNTRFIELAGEINTKMPYYVVDRAVSALNDTGKPLKGSRILVLGLAYKAGIDDERESPAYVIMDILEKRGAKVFYNDPYIPKIPRTRAHGNLAGRKSSPVTDEYDLILVVTNHTQYRDFDFRDFSIPVVDSRNCISLKPKLYYKA